MSTNADNDTGLHPAAEWDGETRALLLPFVLVGALGLVIACALWWVHGESIYLDRLVTGIANCF
jgi:hypothetical protein